MNSGLVVALFLDIKDFFVLRHVEVVRFSGITGLCTFRARAWFSVLFSF